MKLQQLIPTTALLAVTFALQACSSPSSLTPLGDPANTNPTLVNTTPSKPAPDPTPKTDTVVPAPQPAPAPTPTEPTSRDPWLWPFAQTSIWNMPIGSGAQYVPAKLGRADEVIVDTNLLYKVPAGAPERKVYRSAEWIDRCNPNTRLEQFAWTKRKTMPIPDDLVVPDANSNNASAFLLADGRTLVQVNPLARCQAGGPAFGEFSPDVDIYGPGIEGGHGGSGMSSIGGTLRKGELTGSGPIRHALKITLQASRYVAPKRDGTDGYRWPALRADGYAFDGQSHAYGGKVPELELGALLALRPEVTAESLGVQTEVGRKLIQALQDYGAYVVDDAYCHCHNITAEPGVELELNQKYGFGLGTENGPIMQDINRIWPALQVVNNNAPDRIGGGGTPRRPLAPAFVN